MIEFILLIVVWVYLDTINSKLSDILRKKEN